MKATKRIVIDANIVLSSLLNEHYSEEAIKVLKYPVQSEASIFAPELICLEVANVLWVRADKGDIDVEAAQTLYTEFKSFPINLVCDKGLADLAISIALDNNCTVYDACYLALCKDLNAALASFDKQMISVTSNMKVPLFL